MRRLPAVERRQQLYAVALSLFAERGYRATTMDDIAEAAGVTKPLVYQHFASKRASTSSWSTRRPRPHGRGRRRHGARRGPRQQVELGFAAYFTFVVATTRPSASSTAATTARTRIG